MTQRLGPRLQPTMSDIEKARELFQGAGLAFPTIPDELAARLTERGPWVFSTRPAATRPPIESPYNLHRYVDESEHGTIEAYALLAHSGHGVNSYAIQYYLVQNHLRMFLHLSWGGVYMNAEKTRAEIRDCFSMADQIVVAAQRVGRFKSGQQLMVVGSDFYGGYWLRPGESGRGEHESGKEPLDVLSEAHQWLTGTVLRS